MTDHNQRQKNDDLFAAIRENKVEKIKVALESGADINCSHPAYNNTGYPLGLALALNSNEAVQYLIQNGADPNGMKGEVITDAIYRGNHLALQEMLKSGAVITHKAIDAINSLIETKISIENLLPIVKVLLDYDVKPQDLLLIAISAKNNEMKEYLLNYISKKNLNERLEEKLPNDNTYSKPFKM
jgi:ankyrin repeat protein